MPVLATSGLDDDVKLWIASANEPAGLTSLREVRCRSERRLGQLGVDMNLALAGAVCHRIVACITSVWYVMLFH